MELIALWHLFKRRWWLMALPAAVALILTLPTLKQVVSPSPAYAVQVRLTAAAPPNAETASDTTPYEDSVYVPLLASEYVAVNLPHWITSDSFADEVSRMLSEQGTTISPGDLRGAFHGDSFRSIVTLYVSWDDPDPQFAAEPVQVVPLDTVSVSQVAPPITARATPLIKIMLGLAAGVGLAILAEYLDTAVRTRDDVEALGLQVLAVIPRDRSRSR